MAIRDVLLLFLTERLICSLLHKDRTQRIVPIFVFLLQEHHVLPVLRRMEELCFSSVECSCEVATQLRFLARPREMIVLHKSSPEDVVQEPELQIQLILEEIKVRNDC